MKKQIPKQLLLAASVLLGTTALTGCQSDDVGEVENEFKVVATLEAKVEETGNDEIIEIVDEQDVELNEDEDELIEEEMEPEVISLSLGDTFQFGYFEIELGSEIQFVLHQQGERADVPDFFGELHTFSARQSEQFYLSAYVTDIREDVEVARAGLWPTYYRPDGTSSDASIHNSLAVFAHESHSFSQLGGGITTVETYFRFEYSEDGQYIVYFQFREDFYSEVTKEFELLIDVEWPNDYMVVEVEFINQPAGESFQVGNFQVVVGSEVIESERSMQGRTIHYFPVTVTNIGNIDEHLSALNFASGDGQRGLVPSGYIVFEGEEIPMEYLLNLSPGMSMSFQLPAYATTCSTLAHYRSFYLAERIVDPETNNITIRYYHSFACVWNCS